MVDYLNHFRALHRNARLFLVSNVLVNISTGAIGVTYTIYLTRLGYTPDFLSRLLVVGIAGAGLGLIPASVIASRYSARRLLIWSDLLGGVAAAGQLIFPQPLMLVLTSFFVGVSASIFIVLTPPLLTAVSTSAERTHLFSLNATLGFLTGVLGTLIGGFLPSLLGQHAVLNFPLVRLIQPLLVGGAARPLQLSLLVAGALGIPTIWPLFLMDDTVAGAATPASADVPGQWLRAELERYRAAALALLGAAGRATLLERLRRFTRWRGLRFLGYQSLLGLGAGLFLTYLNLFFVNHLHLSIPAYGVVSSVSTVLLAVATLGAPILAERAGEVRGAVIAQMLSVPFLALMAVVTKVPVVIVLFLARSVLMNMGQPTLQSFIMGILPPGERSAASSIFNVGWQVMLAIGGILSGYVIYWAGYPPIFLLAALCYLGGMALLVPWFGQEKQLLQLQERSEQTALPS